MEKEIYKEIIKEMKSSMAKHIPYEIEENEYIEIEKEKMIGANINIIGEKECEFYIFGEREIFHKIAKKNHGFDVPEEILPSYVGEFWNYVLAPIIKEIKKMQVNIDISHSKPILEDIEKSKFDNKMSMKIKEEGIEIGNINIYSLDVK